LATFLAPTAGWARVAGYDTTTHSLEARRASATCRKRPLYPEMRVDEYLAFRGRLKGLRGERLERACAR
jgi:ABC-2 type transport system ATP-binding protein